MRINYIKTKGFRKFEKEFETKLYDITTITGANTKGKTNILYAIIWAFLGTNLTGDDKVWLGNKNSEDCYVEIKFTDNNGEQHILARYKNKYNNKKNFILLDNKKVEPEKLQAFYNDKKLFLSILNPNYFINKKPAEQKEMLDKYLPEIDIASVYNKLEDFEKAYLEGIPTNIIEYLQELNSNKKMNEDKIKNCYGKIDYAEQIASEDIEEKMTFGKDEELSLARQELSFLTTDIIDKNKQQQIVDNLNTQIAHLEQQIKELTEKMTTGKQTYLSIKNQEVAHCPTCSQVIKEESKQTTIANMKKDLEIAFENRNKIETELSDLKSKLIVEKCKLHALDGAKNEDKEKEIATVQTQIENLEQEKLNIEKHNNSVTLKQSNKNQAKQDILTLKKQIADYEKEIENIKETKSIVQKLLINYIEEKMKFATKHLKNVKIKYYSVLKDSGELKDDFIITYNDNELKKLSRSEIIATSLELSNMLNKISKINVPLFVDDSESCADYNFTEQYAIDTQLLIARVEKGQELKIQNSSLQNNEQLQAA